MSAPRTISDAEADGWGSDCLYQRADDEARMDRWNEDPREEQPTPFEIGDEPRVVSRPSDLGDVSDFTRGIDLVLAAEEDW